jgi:hypothetical protein
MTPRAALGVIAPDRGRRVMAKLGWVATVALILALVCAWFLWESDINAFLAARRLGAG